MGEYIFFTGLSQDIKCPICKKMVPSDEAEVHLVMCLTRPKITYNGTYLLSCLVPSGKQIWC